MVNQHVTVIQFLKLALSMYIQDFLTKLKHFTYSISFFICFSQQEMKKREFKTFKEKVKSHFPETATS